MRHHHAFHAAENVFDSAIVEIAFAPKRESSSSERKSVNSFWSISNSLNLFEGNKKVGFIWNGRKGLQV
ncbi:hypothetical protein CRU79_17390 [Escherichia sp. E4385]|nr:hypothetical protein CRU79_17390 [Escherichia sp. E4385]